MALYFITGNKNKFDEVSAILGAIEQLDLDLPEIQDSDARNIIQAKLVEALKHTSKECIVEDTSLYLDCLNGLPGPFIKWFLKAIGNEGLAAITEKFANPAAEAKTIVGYAKNSREIYFFEGSVRGKIVRPRGNFSLSRSGFGWDSIFQPDGFYETFAEMNPEKKNEISMRRMALNAFKKFLEEE